jgi:hypothetical protein
MALENGTQLREACECAEFLDNSACQRHIGKENQALEEILEFVKDFAQKGYRREWDSNPR